MDERVDETADAASLTIYRRWRAAKRGGPQGGRQGETRLDKDLLEVMTAEEVEEKRERAPFSPLWRRGLCVQTPMYFGRDRPFRMNREKNNPAERDYFYRMAPTDNWPQDVWMLHHEQCGFEEYTDTHGLWVYTKDSIPKGQLIGIFSGTWCEPFAPNPAKLNTKLSPCLPPSAHSVCFWCALHRSVPLLRAGYPYAVYRTRSTTSRARRNSTFTMPQ